MAYSVVFKVQHTGLPPEVQERARLLLDEIGETCSSVPRDDAFWFYMKESGLTLVPLSLYFSSGKVKVELALARGKRTYDKRQDLARRDADREVQRALGRRGKGMND